MEMSLVMEGLKQRQQIFYFENFGILIKDVLVTVLLE